MVVLASCARKTPGSFQTGVGCRGHLISTAGWPAATAVRLKVRVCSHSSRTHGASSRTHGASNIRRCVPKVAVQVVLKDLKASDRKKADRPAARYHWQLQWQEPERKKADRLHATKSPPSGPLGPKPQKRPRAANLARRPSLGPRVSAY